MRLLVVEDNARVASFVARGLREQSFAVDVVASGEDALDQMAMNPYDLVVLDIGLQGAIDGMEVCRRLRAGGSRVLILMLTARDSTADRIAGLDAGADDYLAKPFAFGELVARVRALLRRGHVATPAVIEVGGLRVDTSAQRVERAGRAIELTTKEYALLEFFARNAGRVIGRGEISEHVWDENFDPVSNLIEVYVQRLRRKLGSPPLLHTRRGAGYALRSHEDDTSDE
ncbi:MAG: two-component system, OmpR family, response regulator [Thermoanaerobaculia bacterium]|jgi:two-component system copper resistance phosphate regulon response regulator CusR|nr:two-component system, OmpR family, response regulator [Thermoanaerobaculia bacterium]